MAGKMEFSYSLEHEGWRHATTIYRNREYCATYRVMYKDGKPINSVYGVKGGKMVVLRIENVTEHKVLIDYNMGFNKGNKANVEKGVVGHIIEQLENEMSSGDCVEHIPFGYFREWARC